MLLYAPTLGRPPIWDDHTFVFGQPFLNDCDNLRQVVSLDSFRGVLGVRGSARPVWLTSVLADSCLGGGRVSVYRVTSALWHALGALALTLLAWSLSKDELTALMAGALFAVHPLHVEAVSIITFRPDLLCLAFMLTCVLLHRESRLRSGWRAAAFHTVSLIAAAFALLSKEVAVVLPLLLLLSDALFPTGARGPKRVRGLWAGAARCAALVALYLVYRAPRSGYVMRSSRDMFSELHQKTELPFSRAIKGPVDHVAAEPLEDRQWQQVYSDPGARARTMSRIFGSYLRRLAWPWPLQGDYAPKVVSSWLSPGVLSAWAAWLLLLLAAWRLRERMPLASYGIVWTGVALLPVSGVVAILNLEADRYLYIPSAGACLAAAAYLRGAMRRGAAWSRAAMAVFILALCAGSFLTVKRLADFSGDEAFHRATLAVDPDVPRARLSLAMICADEGRDECAVSECREALRLWPGYPKAKLFCSDVLRER
ncbi:MAG: hypothetical protein ABL955_02790 [Elusimicrobiota bacterium]